MTGSIYRNAAEVKIDTSHYGKLTGMAIYDPELQRYQRGTTFNSFDKQLHVLSKTPLSMYDNKISYVFFPI